MVKTKNKIFSIALCLILCLAMVLAGIKIASGRNGVSAEGETLTLKKDAEYKLRKDPSTVMTTSEFESLESELEAIATNGEWGELDLSKISVKLDYGDDHLTGAFSSNTKFYAWEGENEIAVFNGEEYVYHVLLSDDKLYCKTVLWGMFFDDTNGISQSTQDLLWFECDGIGEEWYYTGLDEMFNAFTFVPTEDIVLTGNYATVMNLMLEKVGGDAPVEETGIDLYSGLAISGAMLVIACGCAVVMSKMKRKQSI